MNEIFNLIKEVIVWYFDTDLPHNTAIAFADIIKYSNDVLIPLLYEYIGTIL